MSSPLSRRDWLRSLIRPKSTPAPTPPPLDQPSPSLSSPDSSETPDTVAVIAGRFCLPYQGSFCTTCSEHCPEPGAIVIEQGLPRVVPETCTGCRLCHDVCPAPEENAIRLVPRRRPSS